MRTKHALWESVRGRKDKRAVNFGMDGGISVAAAIVVLVVLVVLGAGYMILIQLQLRSMNRQLEKRLAERTLQPIRLELLNRELSDLAVNINRCLQEEERLRLDTEREEKRFKEMVSYLSHDLRTPLTAIRGYQQLMEAGPLTDEQRARLQTAQKHTALLGGLVERFFEYSYLVSASTGNERTLEAEAEVIRLDRLAGEALAAAVPELEQKGLSADLIAPSPVLVRVHKERTGRIMLNLLRNAVAYSAGPVTVRVQQEGESGVLSFSNPVAPGAAPDPGRLFERFYAFDSSGSRSTGLGLHIVKLLAEQMGGAAEAGLCDGTLEIRIRLPSA